MENDQVRIMHKYLLDGIHPHLDAITDCAPILLNFRAFSSTFTSPASARRPVRFLGQLSRLALLIEPQLCHIDRLITSKDHASVQISVVDVDSNGRALNTTTSFALCGQVRADGESDDSLNRLATKAGRTYYPHAHHRTQKLTWFRGDLVLRNVWSYQK